MCFYCDMKHAEEWWWRKYACFQCRRTNDLLHTPKSNFIEHGGKICSGCNKQMVDVGFKFEPPKKADVKKWKTLEQTWENQHKIVDGVRTYVGPSNQKVKQRF
jgi:hypothetical protein